MALFRINRDDCTHNPFVRITSPLATSLGGDSLLCGPTPLIEGGQHNSDRIEVYLDGVYLGDATISGNRWSYQMVGLVHNNAHVLEVIAYDNETATTSTHTVNAMVDAFTTTTILTPPAGATDMTGAIIISGSGETGNTIQICRDGVELAEVLADDVTGTWQWIPSPLLENGTANIEVKSTDRCGNLATDTVTFLVSLPPPIVNINTNDPVGFFCDVRPTVFGSAIRADQVSIFLNGVFVSVVPVIAGAWSYTFQADLLENTSYVIDAVATGPSGSATASLPPSFVNADTEIFLTNPSPIGDSTLSTSTPTIRGLHEADAQTVFVTIDGGTPQIAVLNSPSPNDWAYTVTTPLTDGPHTVFAEVTDNCGNTDTVGPINFEIAANGTIGLTQFNWNHAIDPFNPTPAPFTTICTSNDGYVVGTYTTPGNVPATSMTIQIDSNPPQPMVIDSIIPSWPHTRTFTYDFSGMVHGTNHVITILMNGVVSQTFNVNVDAFAGGNITSLMNGGITNAIFVFSGVHDSDISSVNLAITHSGGVENGLATLNTPSSGNWSYTNLTNMAPGPATVVITYNDACFNSRTETITFNVV